MVTALAAGDPADPDRVWRDSESAGSAPAPVRPWWLDWSADSADGAHVLALAQLAALSAAWRVCELCGVFDSHRADCGRCL